MVQGGTLRNYGQGIPYHLYLHKLGQLHPPSESGAANTSRIVLAKEPTN